MKLPPLEKLPKKRLQALDIYISIIAILVAIILFIVDKSIKSNSDQPETTQIPTLAVSSTSPSLASEALTFTPIITFTTSISSNPSDTITPSPTFTETSTPSPTPTKTTTPTSTKTPLPTPTLMYGTIFEDCIPSPWAGKDLPFRENCVDLQGAGISPKENGLTVFAIARNENELEKVFLTLPISKKIKSISFNLKINHFQESYRPLSTQLFFGLADGDNPNLSGTYILFDKSPDTKFIYSSHLLNRAPFLDIQRRFYSEYSDGMVAEIEFSFGDLTFDIVRDGNRDYGYTPRAWPDVKNPVFVIGYIVPPGGGLLSAEITDFNIQFH